MPLILRRIAVGVLITCALSAVGASLASATPDNSQLLAVVSKHLSMNNKQDKLCQEASAVRRKVIKQFGKRTPGRDICKSGLPSGQKPSKSREEHYLQTLQRMIAPPVASATASSSQSWTVSTSSSSTGGGGLPSCASESGTNYSTGSSNTNSSSGATGRYQIIPSTHVALCSDLGWSPSEQDQCAARIYQAQGSGAWVGCGG
ncbi:MAG TPA: hypothetical protein VN778_00020 [Verrucomicrobiae bacterium]|nr:hypothetical protein [Verrucomicrobiae bacterium]